MGGKHTSDGFEHPGSPDLCPLPKEGVRKKPASAFPFPVCSKVRSSVHVGAEADQDERLIEGRTTGMRGCRILLLIAPSGMVWAHRNRLDPLGHNTFISII